MVFGYMQAKEANMPMETLRIRSKACLTETEG